jgi:predicted Fe-S protein YdhL (DUF1289 family)
MQRDNQTVPQGPQSPCVSVCALDENDVCLGCFRTAEEITDWFFADARQKHAIVVAAEERRRRAGWIIS